MSKHFVDEAEVAGYNCAARLFDGWREHPCGRRAKTTRCGAPLCGTHARTFDKNHALRVSKDYGDECGRIRQDRPEGVPARFRVNQTSAFGEPYLERITWEEGKRWEDANPDERAVLEEYIRRAQEYEQQQQAHLAKLAEKIRDAARRIDRLEEAASGG